MLQWKRNHACEQLGQGIWKDYQRKDKTAGPNNESIGQWKSGCATVDHLIVLKQTMQEIQEKRHTAYIIFLDVQKAYDKAWLDAIIYTLDKNGVHDKNLRMIKKINSNLTARIQTRYGLTRKINIRDSIRQGGVLSVIEYATPWMK